MKELQNNSAWKNLLPKTFNWLEKVKFSATQSFQPGVHQIVPVTTDKTAEVGYKISALGINNDLINAIHQATTLTGWKGKGDAVTVIVNSTPFVLVPTSALCVTKAQKSRQLGIDAYKCLENRKISGLVIYESPETNALEIFEGIALGSYSCHGFKKDSCEKEELSLPTNIYLYSTQYKDQDYNRHISMAKSIAFSRQLQDAPPNFLDSVKFAEYATLLSQAFGLKCSIMGRQEIINMGMGSFASVAAGSAIDPKLITIEIEGVDKSKTVALVGKGLTFDAGGISIKPSAGMHEMKYDMCGGAAVLGAAMYFGMEKPPVNVICTIGAVENMVGYNATRPGDIVKAMNGKTIEVLNTDAEGRLVLADLLVYVSEKYKPNLTIDIATLTGAVLMGLGTAGAAVMTNDPKTGEYMKSMSETSGEPIWELPLWPELEKEINSEIADYKNIADPSVKAGTIIGGMFLKQFVTGSWAHLDIAGTGWSCKATGYPTKGGSGFGVRILTEACLNFK